MDLIDISHSDEIYTVSRLNREVRLLLEGSFPLLWVEGEISNFAAPHSGHWYFGIKDSSAQIRCAMFRTQNTKLKFLPKDGMHVLIKARISLYEGRGDYQLLVEHIEDAGEGKLRQEFEALKKRLQEAGLFSDAHKKPLPPIPQKIGIITSPTGAAIRDILSVLNRRFPLAEIIIYPSLVQGDLAADNLVKAIQLANQRNECDVLILSRGGGSLEDLWPFNEERVAYAIHQSTLPIISGIGHEVDFTIADFVADVRAPTPSAAAELIAPDTTDILEMLAYDQKQLGRLIKQQLQIKLQQLTFIQKNLQQQHPKHRLAEQAQRLDLYESTLVRLQTKLLTAYSAKVHMLNAKLQGATPRHKIRELKHQLNHDLRHLQNCMMKSLTAKQQLLGNAAVKLETLSPLSTLKRGYAIATNDKDQRVLLQASEVKPGDKIRVKLMDGELGCRVETIK